ncbi:MAG: hypothetical protein KGJ23_15615 [Euryarchaeota archaeon]|nr:hypothetical protein [Euryarchaeota archaeon]MDE1838027.1 hypothetical protein [Euryarchaeota archaeon]MDE2045044.1 hypothetical protein [Thermoplasmata archaeon]
MSVEIVTRWFGVYAVENGRITLARPFPAEKAGLLERWALRREGRILPDEEALVRELRAQGKNELLSRDRRLSVLAVHRAFGHLPEIVPPGEGGLTREMGRGLLLEQGRKDLARAWDPSVHLEEAVRALSDLDETLNLLGERLSSWWGRERPEEAAGEESPRAVSEALRKEAEHPSELGPGSLAPGPELSSARRSLAELWLRSEEVRRALEKSVELEAPRRFPNLTALLGPLLTARMLSQAGGLSRLARMPASTVQVLGAERAFFEHLRGRGPPPRHGLLFLHPSVHTAPRAQRGKIARALAGKVAIASRRDLEGVGALPALSEAFERRLAEIRRPRKGGPSSTRGPAAEGRSGGSNPQARAERRGTVTST